MPTTIESGLVLLVLLAPGFIAVRVKNSLLPYRPSSAFQETIEAAILSALLLPVWLVFGWRLLKARHHLVVTSTTLAPLEMWTLLPAAGVIVLVYVVISPVLGVLYALIQAKQPYRTAVGRLVRSQLDVHAHPEVWDRAFNRDVQPWVRVSWKGGTSIQVLPGSPAFLPPADNSSWCLCPVSRSH